MVDRGDLTYIIRGVGLIKRPRVTWARLLLRLQDGMPVYLEDLGTLKYGNFERKGVFGFTDRERDYSESVQGIVQLAPLRKSLTGT